MKIKPEQLTPLLKKSLAPIYLVSGDEFLLVQETCDIIRKHAVSSGYEERETFYIEPGFNWENFLNSVNNFSLFGNQKLIELHIRSKLTEGGGKILQNYAENPSADKILLIVTNKLDASLQKTAWFKAIDSSGYTIAIWPLDQNQFPSWINNRLLASGLKINNEGLKLLADHVVGNLLAAVQEIEKLVLLYGKGNLTASQISEALSDNARFNIYNLLDAAINKTPEKINRILSNLKNENIDPTLILWSIANELRSLINISFAIKNGVNIEDALTQNNIWPKRKPAIKKLLAQYNLEQLHNLLKKASTIDLIIKGANNQQVLWHELERLYLTLALA